MSQTIFDILTSSQETREPALSRDDDLFLSIRDHLRRLFNTRRGALTHLPHYGMPDIVALYQGLPYSRDTIMNCLRQCILDFEPRLQNPVIRPRTTDNGEDVTQFEIVAETITGDQVKNICTLYRNGSIQLETTWEYYQHVSLFR